MWLLATHTNVNLNFCCVVSHNHNIFKITGVENPSQIHGITRIYSTSMSYYLLDLLLLSASKYNI